MAVAMDAFAESHTGTTGSTSEASFTWTHTPTGTPRGVIVFVFTNVPANDATSVTYGGVAVPAVSGAQAFDSAIESGCCTIYFLGQGVPTGAQSVVVNRTNNADVMYAISTTVTALGDTEVPLASIVLLQEDQALAEQNVDDGSPGTNSVRFAGVNWGGNPIPGVGANSTTLISINFGTRTCRAVYETVAGQGSRPVGFSAASDDVAAVHFAVIESPHARRYISQFRRRAG